MALELSAAALLILAKKHLGLRATAQDRRVPTFYLEELRDHLKLYPLEDNFRVTLQPKIGFGTATCLKDGCNQAIPLTRRAKCDDGGKKDGLGSLSAYREHLSSHLLQETRVRTRSGKIAAPSTSIKAENLPPSVRQRRALTRLSSLSGLKAQELVKAEPVEKTVPRKRHSDQAFARIKNSDEDKNPSLSVPVKRIKTESASERPLASVTNTPAAASSSSSKATAMIYPPLEYKVDDVRSATRGNLPQSANPPAARLSMEGIQTGYLDIGRASKLERPKHPVHVPSGLSRPAVKSEPRAASSTQSNARAWRNGPPTLAPFPMKLDRETPPPSLAQPSLPPPSFALSSNTVKYEPFARRDISQSTHLNPPRANVKAEPLTASINNVVVPQVEVKRFIAYNPVSSSSRPASIPVASSSTFSRDVKQLVTNRDVKPFAQPPLTATTSARTSTSGPSHHPLDQKIRFPGTYVDVSDDDDDSDDALDAMMFPPVPHFVNQIGVNIRAINDDAHDANGDYYGRGRDMFVGPQAANDDIDKFLVEAGNAENFDGNETVDKALVYLGLGHLEDKLPGMDISLMPHQVMGVAWMLEKERSSILGGCLADEMGLGKTVQMIATLVKNSSTDPECRTNLIIAPLALLDQWKLEIEEKTNCNLTCLIYHGPSRTRRKSDLLKYDVVLTTFNTMAHEWPDYENEMKKKAKAKKRRQDDFIVEDSDEEDMRSAHYRADKRKKHVGILFQVKFFRIIADEGQQIRNRRTRMSRAITDLQGHYRWVLTGTPIVNTLADVYGYIRFLKIRPWYDWTEFNYKIALLERKNPTMAVARLQKLMTTFLLRRKKDSQLDGKKLIELPPKEVLLRRLEFSVEEREIYSMVEARSQAKFNRYLREGTVLKNYHQVLVLLLRLRQICSHPSLIQEDGVAFVHPDEAHVNPEFATELTRARRLVSAEFVTKMQEKFKQQTLARMDAERQSDNATVDDEDCPICFDVMTDAVITSCTHIFCRDCIVDVLNSAPPMDPADQAPGAQPKLNERACPVCRSAISEQALFSREAFMVSDKDLKKEPVDDDAMDVSHTPLTTSKKGKGKAVKKPKKRISRRAKSESEDERDFVGSSESEYDDDDDGDSMSDFIVESDEDEEEKDVRRALKQRQPKKNTRMVLDSDDEPDTPEEKDVIFGLPKKVDAPTSAVVPIMSRFLPSSKMKYMMDQLKKLKHSNPEEKTLVVSQWTGCLSLISDYLTENGIPHVKYQGDMNRAKRDQAVQVFMAKEKARVMLMSLKCGGVGLNLTRANNVISLDLGWSQAVEAQAYDRVHRLGQTRKVTVQRIVIADTVEDRILALQDRKQALADGSLGEGSGKKIGKLSVKELANLFGLDARGRLIK